MQDQHIFVSSHKMGWKKHPGPNLSPNLNWPPAKEDPWNVDNGGQPHLQFGGRPMGLGEQSQNGWWISSCSMGLPLRIPVARLSICDMFKLKVPETNWCLPLHLSCKFGITLNHSLLQAGQPANPTSPKVHQHSVFPSLKYKSQKVLWALWKLAKSTSPECGQMRTMFQAQ